MSVLPWFEHDGAQNCGFFKSVERIGSTSCALTDLQEPDVIIACNDGKTLLAHRTVLGQSQKLQAAIRFVSMRDEHSKKDDITSCDTITLKVDLAYSICRQLLIHMYHGSLLLDERPADPHEFCLQMFELIVVADEYICTSLIRECILRLLATADMFDRCYCRHCQGGNTRRSGDGKYRYCTYHVAGPSHLITAALALDVLAIAQHVSWCPDNDDDLNDNVIPSLQQSTITTKRTKSLINHLREVALSQAICDFGAVIRSQTFTEQFENKTSFRLNDASKRAAGMLLMSLLNDFYEVGRV